MSTTITPPAETPAVSQPTFDFIANRERIRAEEKLKREGKVTVAQAPEPKPVEAKAPEVPATPPPAETPAVPAEAESVTPEAPAAPAATPEPPVVEKRATGRERNFKKQLSQRDRQIGALQEKLNAIEAQIRPAIVAEPPPAAGKPPVRTDFTTDEDFRRAEIQFEARRVVEEQRAADAQEFAIQETAATYGERMQNGPKKYEDWDDKLKAAEGTAITTFDLMDEKNGCLPLLGAILSSPYPEDCFYHWFNKPDDFKKLIDTYRSGPRGQENALMQFWMLSGRVGKDEIPDKKKVSATTAPAVAAPVVPPAPPVVSPPIPRPSSEVGVRSGEPVGDGAPPVKIPGTNMLNPAWQAWNRARNRK